MNFYTSKIQNCFILWLALLTTFSITAVRADIVAHWPLDEGSGTTANDVTGNGHNGVFVNHLFWEHNILRLVARGVTPEVGSVGAHSM